MLFGRDTGWLLSIILSSPSPNERLIKHTSMPPDTSNIFFMFTEKLGVIPCSVSFWFHQQLCGFMFSIYFRSSDLLHNDWGNWHSAREVILKNNITETIMTSSNGTIFRITSPLCWESTGHRWKTSDAELWCILWFAPEHRAERTIRTPWFVTRLRSLWHHCNDNNTYKTQLSVGNGHISCHNTNCYNVYIHNITQIGYI